MKHVEKTRRIGLLVPSSNSTQEPESAQMLPPSSTLNLGVAESMPGFGRLLREMPALPNERWAAVVKAAGI